MNLSFDPAAVLSFTTRDIFPYPQWKEAIAAIDTFATSEQRRTAWLMMQRYWFERLAERMEYETEFAESERFLVLCLKSADFSPRIARFAEECRTELVRLLGDVVDFTHPGKHPILAFPTPDWYYAYISDFFPEGNFGASAGMCLRNEVPHIAAMGKDLSVLFPTVAHELVHTGLNARTLPQWVEEGLAQMFERDMAVYGGFEIDSRAAQKHKHHWTKNGLESFWSGECFFQSGRGQQLGYQLAETLVRLMISEAHPTWFGWGRDRRREFFEFLKAARVSDGGATAAKTHLRYYLGALAARFLGPGEWSPQSNQYRLSQDETASASSDPT